MSDIYDVNLALVLAGLLVACSAAFADVGWIKGVPSYLWYYGWTPSTVASIVGYRE